MAVIGRTNHAFFFDGVSDSIVVPQGLFTAGGLKNEQDKDDYRPLFDASSADGRNRSFIAEGMKQIVVEAWVVPDCGGTVIESEGQFKLSVGNVDTPGPAVFEVNTSDGSATQTFTLSTATQTTSPNRYEGTVYPIPDFASIHDSYNRFDGAYDDATDLNRNHRQLLHLIGVLDSRSVRLYVNNVLMAEQKVNNTNMKLVSGKSNMFIGGKGGQFRGVMESIHISSTLNDAFLSSEPPTVTEDTLLLYRFEEPIAPIEEVYDITSLSSNSDVIGGQSVTISQISLSDTQATSLAKKLTGLSSVSGNYDFTATPYSSGNYEVVSNTGTAVNTYSVPHVPYNILINPNSINPNTRKPNQTPPERMRVHSINVDTNTMLVSSVHLDFSSSLNGLRGALTTSRTTGVDNHFVVINSDLLIDGGSGRPYQPPHYATQVIDRTGQMVIDESGYDNHGFVYSSRMATTANDTTNPFAVSWPATLDESFQLGHSGRHTKNHVDGHAFLRMLPPAQEEVISLKSDGTPDNISLIYDLNKEGVDEQLSMNSRVDVYREYETTTVIDCKSESTVDTIYNSGLAAGTRTLIAIGGDNFDFTPFLLKGPSLQKGSTPETNLRTHHLRPSKNSRVALLHIPALRASYNMAPFVEIHYNAVDLTGASMDGSNTAKPLLMVEKTVPSSDTAIGNTNIYDIIAANISGGLTIHAPGGYLDVFLPDVIETHQLVGDNSEGYDSDDELDESYTPVNYTPYSGSTVGNSPPKIVQDSTSQTTDHESVFHRLVIGHGKVDVSLTSKGIYDRKDPLTLKDSPANGEYDIGIISSSTPIYEMFDIIDNQSLTDASPGANARLIVQPTDRRRTNQLSHIRKALETPNQTNSIGIKYLMTKARVRSVEEREESDFSGQTVINCEGISSALTNRSVDVRGRGSPDSHVVKEIEPNAPVVTVTLGGPGQGAMDTKPTMLKSPLAHLPFSTRRAYAVAATTFNHASNGSITVKPLNNDSPDMASWGTYGFARYGNIYFEDGSRARYSSKTGNTFSFSLASIGAGDYVSADGEEFTTIAGLLTSLGYLNNTSGIENSDFPIYSEPDFGDQSLIDNGSTVNDRMFQGGSDVNQDYQLGTQYASTRALVEIPFFANQFFDTESSFVGPDNSFKIHLDATMTAHTWNPSPVGRRQKSKAPADREVNSAYSFSKSNESFVSSASVVKFDAPTDSATGKLYVTDATIFPVPDTNPSTYQNISTALRFRRVFLPDGSWAFYSAVNTTDHYLTIPQTKYAISKEFAAKAEQGTAVMLSGPLPTESIVPMSSDSFTPSSDFEQRGEYYHDAASVKTQGGNVDYGLRQYVSAVEFKAGPESNPHAAKVKTGRAKGVVREATVLGSADYFTVVATLSDEDFKKFPDIGIRSMNDISNGTMGDLFYEVEWLERTGAVETLRKFHYYGSVEQITNYDNNTDTDIASNSVVLVYYQNNTTQSVLSGTEVYPTWSNMVGSEITLTGRKRRIHFDEFTKFANASDNGIVVRVTGEKNPVYNEIFANVHHRMGALGTKIAITAQDAAAGTITITAPNTGVDDTFDFNLRKGDHVFVYYDSGNPSFMYLGTLKDIPVYASSMVLTLDNAFPAIDMSASPKIGIANNDYVDADAILNSEWLNPFAAGGLRNGDTIWGNMTYNNPHAVEGLFFKSRGVYNESMVWSEFNGGEGSLHSTNPRDSIPLENFLIGDDCKETAINFAQHVNRTIEENYKSLGLTASQAPTVAYVDPHLSEEGHARVLLYDLAHEREFIALQDIHMQVQTSAEATRIGWNRFVVNDSDTVRTDLAILNARDNGAAPSAYMTQIDVANGYPSQNPFVRSTQQSKFIESAYAHDIPNRQAAGLTENGLVGGPRLIKNARLYGKGHGHFVHSGYTVNGNAEGYTFSHSRPPRTELATVSTKVADELHPFSRMKSLGFTDALVAFREANHTFRDPSTLFDTPDGTRVIPAYLCLKGIRSSTLDLSSHEESRLQHLPQWKDMDFVRRLTIDAGEIAQKDGVDNVQSAAEEIVRTINQYAALKGRLSDGGSSHDPAVWWDTDKAFSTNDRGSHMGYLRAHIGREVQDVNGNVGFTVIIHSTVPGATGRNFCVWLDNSKAQTPYQPKFLIGHGGRWRNFWALPEEIDGENMHPAPMPLNKHGRPFAPVTTLQQYMLTSDIGEDVVATSDFGNQEQTTLYAASDTLSGKSHNTVVGDSFDAQGNSATLVRGLRVGTGAIGRINFGGLVATGVPGWAPSAGNWGFGKNNDKHYMNRYRKSVSNFYTDHVPVVDKLDENVGKGDLYGLHFKDHRGDVHGVRFIYKKVNDNFANENTVLPSTLENEIGIFFDDRDVGEGGFTIGSHMTGKGDATGRMDLTAPSSPPADSDKYVWKGNRWRGVPAPNVAVKASVDFDGDKITITQLAPFASLSLTTDVLGYLGFPKENGLIQLTDMDGVGQAGVGSTVSYERRQGDTFYGVKKDSGLSTDTFFLISPVLNWTCLVTDELLAAVTEFAVNNDEVNSPEGVPFDCRHMYAADGRTFGDWGVKEDAIVVRAFNVTAGVKPLSTFFEASVHPDFGIQAAHLEFGEIEKATVSAAGVWSFGSSNHMVSDADLDAGRQIDCGYVPKTVLQIRTKSKGTNSNTATPVLVDSSNKAVNVTKWRDNLRGKSFTRTSGDHILPKIDNPLARLDLSASSSWTTEARLTTAMHHFMIPAGNETTNNEIPSLGERRRVWLSDDISIMAESKRGANSETTLAWDIAHTNDDRIPTSVPFGPWLDTHDELLSLFGSKDNAWKFDGLRSIGSVFSEPLVYFKGGRDSHDHSVPLFFGGGFSGVVLDVNDGTQNDYSSFYTHPYANGPTGTAGIQNANEISTSFAALDCNAMFAFFPGAALCNQHRGSILPPAFNKDNVLTPDLDFGRTAYSSGVVKAKPIPLVLRFAHPTARYEDHRDGTDSKTTYLIFGPGQAFPFTQEVTNTGSNHNKYEPFSGRVVTSSSTWARVPRFTAGQCFHNHITNSNGDYLPETTKYYHDRAQYHWRVPVNWESPAGFPLGGFSGGQYTTYQRPAHGRMWGQMFWKLESVVTQEMQPLSHTPMIGFGITMAADTVWHMDGGFHAGGSWMDNQLTFNPPHPKKATRIDGSNSSTSWERDNQINPTAFRVAGPLTSRILDYLGSSESVSVSDAKTEYIVVDGTRCQNGEELATVLGAAINSFPGAGALKALGGTHMPSMGNAMRQDRYGWIDLGTVGSSNFDANDNTPKNNYVESAATSDRDLLENLPSSGWLRCRIDDTASTNNTTPIWGCYHSKRVVHVSGSDYKVRFYMAYNKKTSNKLNFEGPNTITPANKLFVWAKAGTIRFNNENDSTRDHMTQAHFSGIVDAVDRTKPIGAVGWHGERYSYLNSVKITTSVTKNGVTTTSDGYAAGLGAYHPSLAFSLYGSAGTAITTLSHIPLAAPMWNSPESLPPINEAGANLVNYLSSPYTNFTMDSNSRTHAWANDSEDSSYSRYKLPTHYAIHTGLSGLQNEYLPDELARPQGLYTSGFLVVSYESETSLIAKYDRDGITCVGDWLQIKGVSSDAIEYAGTTHWDERFHNQDRFVAPANAGPNVEALVVKGTSLPKADDHQSNDEWATDLYKYPVYTTGTTNSNNTINSIASMTGITVGMAVVGTGIPAGAFVKTVNSGTSTVTISPNATASASNVVLSFYNLVSIHPVITDTNTGDDDDMELENATPDRAKTGDLFFDLDYSPGSYHLEPDATGPALTISQTNNGTGYSSATYETTSSGNGVGASVFVTVDGSGTVTSASLTTRGNGYAVNEVLSLVGGGNNATVTITALDNRVQRSVAADNYSTGFTSNSNVSDTYWMGDVNAYQLYDRSAARNFSTEHVVWKRMDGGNLSLPALNARGLGAVPWMTRVKDGAAHVTGEKLFGNVRFSFETTNATMMPVLQAQELSHPKLQEEYPVPVTGALQIPNEELQFQSMEVVDDSGQVHKIEGGSPLGTIIRGFRTPPNRGVEGMAPALANSGNVPNLKVMLPNPDSIPGNIVVRSGFDPIQAYQNETFGSGGMQHPDLGSNELGIFFDNTVKGPRMAPTYENLNWEHIDPLTLDSTLVGWDDKALQTSYELHDRTLLFHVTKMGHSHTHRYPTAYTHSSGVETNNLTGSSWDAPTSVLTVSATIDSDVFAAGFGSKEVSDNRRFIRIYNATTDEGVVASYTGINGATFTGVVGDVDFTAFMAAQTITDLTVVPSYYVPGGSARFFAARRLRDHSEVSGNSPDMAHTLYTTSGRENNLSHYAVAYNNYSRPTMTPMPFPRMGHHYVTPTLPMLPGHWAHPAYQNIYTRHRAETQKAIGFLDSKIITDNHDTYDVKSYVSQVKDELNPLEAQVNFSGVNAAPSPPSDIHGGAFTLMFETGIKYDGYGILASTGNAGFINRKKGHTIVLEAAKKYTLGRHFPDPAEVGAYQIVIQPHLYNTQLGGYQYNSDSLTAQQVNTVVGIKHNEGQNGGMSLVLAYATQADVRGCEVFINEAIMDVNPDFGSQFTNIPPLLLYNSFGVNLTETPSFSRRGFPYSPMFSNATPGYTINIPWWSLLFKQVGSGTNVLADVNNFLGVSQYAPHNYYQMSRSTYGSIGNQLTLQGYPSVSPNIYSMTFENTSIIAKSTVISFDKAQGIITVDDGSTFPNYPNFSEHIEYTAKNGQVYSIAYTKRSGFSADEINLPKTIHTASFNVANGFYDNLFDGAILRIKMQFGIFSTNRILKDKSKSVFSHILPDIINGSKDTNSGYLPDAFLCKWHHNLGRPYTFFSDNDSRAWDGVSVDKSSYNSLPEHFETFHYHAATYAMSNGPFSFKLKTPDTGNNKDGQLTLADSNNDAGALSNSEYGSAMYNRLWPCGSRGGPQASSLDEYVIAVASWDELGDYDQLNLNLSDSQDDADTSNYSHTTGVSKADTRNRDSTWSGTKRRSYGIRIALRQPLNRPRWGIHALRAMYELTANNGVGAYNTTDYRAGPFVQKDVRAGLDYGWKYVGGGTDTTLGGSMLQRRIVGTMETATNYTGMLGIDQFENQVRYSDGRRMTRPFGSPVRVLRNPNGVERDWCGDGEGKGITRLSEASEYYLVDWWGNERGEDVRRAPVRGFGIRPAWDCGDAYEYDRTNSRSPYERVWNNDKPIFNLKGLTIISFNTEADTDNGRINTEANIAALNTTIPRFLGCKNTENGLGTYTLADVFAPTHALRVGDMGNGRGVRYPTHFNEDVLTDISTPVEKTGVVLSANTAEPLFGNGLLRPRNAVLQADEVPRGISARLDVTEDGLLKPEATVSEKTETIVGASVHKDAISRSSPRIGIDAEMMDGVEQNSVVINTEAHSLHTDRNVGQRVIFEGALQNDIGGNMALTNLNLTSGLSFGRQTAGSPVGAALRFSHTNPFRPYGGSYIMETKVFAGLFDDTGWGKDNLGSGSKTSNPYQSETMNRTNRRNNHSASSVQFLLRPIRVLDNKHVQLFRLNDDMTTNSLPQHAKNYLHSTSGGKYGLFSYNTPNSANDVTYIGGQYNNPNSNGKYWPVMIMDSANNTFDVPISFGPQIKGTEVSGFDKTSLSSPVTRLITTENTLQHHRSDAARRKQEQESDEEEFRLDYTVKPRFSQSLHSKGHKGDVDFNVTDHSGDGA